MIGISFVQKTRNSGKWTKIPVPSQWEQFGFGNYNYGHDKVKYDEQGLYKYRFDVQKNWKGNTIYLVFEGVMTDIEVKINGKLAGPTHQGGFYQFKYDITKLLKFGSKNLLEATVSKVSADPSVKPFRTFRRLLGIWRNLSSSLSGNETHYTY